MIALQQQAEGEVEEEDENGSCSWWWWRWHSQSEVESSSFLPILNDLLLCMLLVWKSWRMHRKKSTLILLHGGIGEEDEKNNCWYPCFLPSLAAISLLHRQGKCAGSFKARFFQCILATNNRWWWWWWSLWTVQFAQRQILHLHPSQFRTWVVAHGHVKILSHSFTMALLADLTWLLFGHDSLEQWSWHFFF